VIFLISVVKKPLRTFSQEDQSNVYPHYSMEKWQDAGAPTARQILREKTQDLMSSAPAPDDHDEFIQKGEQFIRKYVI